jgi:hypothetical protein
VWIAVEIGWKIRPLGRGSGLRMTGEGTAQGSKGDFEGELELTGILGAGDLAKVGCKGDAIGNIEVGMVEEIVDFGAPLKTDRLA